MKTWRLFGPLILPYWRRMALALLVSILGSLTDLLRPWPLKIIVDNVVSSKRHHHQQFVESLLTALAGHDRTWLLLASVALVFLIAAVGACATSRRPCG
jgi:ATP-binding cassette subfamily B protein